MQQSPMIPFMDKVRYIGYGAIGGLVFGAIIGWMFHGWVGFFVRLGFVILLLIPLVLAILFWKRVTTPSTPASPGNDVVMTSRRTRQDGDAVRDAEWVELNPPTRTRR